MTEQPRVATGRRADLPIAEGELDADLARTVRRTSYMRQGFYVVVLLVALAGQVSGAVEALHIPLAAAIPAVGALELGGIVVLANSDVRRRLGERAIASRLLSVAVAAGAVAFNWLAHSDHLLGGFFAGMSALGYLVWLMHTENQRRDRLRSKGDLPSTTPAYEVVGHWLTHPWLTRRARAMAKADTRLGLYDSLAAARAEIRRERRQSAISKVLHRKIRRSVDPTTADIAIAVYDLDEIATRLAAGADYSGLTALIAADLAPARLAINAPSGRRKGRGQPQVVPAPALPTSAPTLALAAQESPTVPVSADPAPDVRPASPTPRVGGDTGEFQALPPAIRRLVQDRLPRTRGATAPGHELESANRPVDDRRWSEVERRDPVVSDLLPPAPAARNGRSDASLRRRVHAALDARVPLGDQRDHAVLVDLVTDELQLDDQDRMTISTYVQTWKRDMEARRLPAP